MILIVETNFILELALQREEEAACREILDLCQPGRIGRLVIPAYAIAEAAMALERSRGLRRRFVHDEVTRHVNDLQRSKPRQRLAGLLGELKEELARAELEEPEALLRAVFLENGIGCAETISLTDSMVRAALMYTEADVVKHMPDALVFSSIIAYLNEPRSVATYFATRDRELAMSAAGELRRRNCATLSSFADALALLRRA